jgi:hypothetical protein
MSTGPHDAGLDGTIPPAPDLTQKIRELRAADRRAETETDAERIERVGAGMRASVSAPREDGHQRSSTSPAMPPDWCGVPAGDLDAKDSGAAEDAVSVENILYRDEREARERAAAWERRQSVAQTQAQLNVARSLVAGCRRTVAKLEGEAAPLRIRLADLVERIDALIEPDPARDYYAHARWASEHDDVLGQIREVEFGAGAYMGLGSEVSRYIRHRPLRTLERLLDEAREELARHEEAAAAAERALAVLEE